MKPIFDIKLFIDPTDAKDKQRSQNCLLLMFEALVNIDQLWIKDHKRSVPPIYKAPVRYEREYGTELWCDIPTILEKGYGDCEDLAAWRCAEIREAGGRASPYVQYKKIEGRYHYHALVKRAGINPQKGAYDKWLEDPSKRLGMGWEEDYRKKMIAQGHKPKSVFDKGTMIGDADDAFGGMGKWKPWKPLDNFIRSIKIRKDE